MFRCLWSQYRRPLSAIFFCLADSRWVSPLTSNRNHARPERSLLSHLRDGGNPDTGYPNTDTATDAPVLRSIFRPSARARSHVRPLLTFLIGGQAHDR